MMGMVRLQVRREREDGRERGRERGVESERERERESERKMLGQRGTSTLAHLPVISNQPGAA